MSAAVQLIGDASYRQHRTLGVVEVSPMRPSERSFVADNWVEGVVEAQGHGRRSGSRHRHAYLVAAGRAVDAHLRDPNVSVLVARDAECGPRAYGWIAGLGHTLLWTCVKRDHRREGLAHILLAALTRELGAPRYFAVRSRHDALAERVGLQHRPLTEASE